MVRERDSSDRAGGRRDPRRARDRSRSRASILLSLLVIAALGCERAQEGLDPTMDRLVSDALWKASNHGRRPLGDDGYFAFPAQVRYLERNRRSLILQFTLQRPAAHAADFRGAFNRQFAFMYAWPQSLTDGLDQ